MAWTTEQVVRITGVSQRKLNYWLGKDIIGAEIDEAYGRGRVRLWSFGNLIEIRVAQMLRDRLSLQLIGKIVRQLRVGGIDSPLTELRFGIADSKVTRREDDVIVQRADGSWDTPLNGQIVIEVVLRFDEIRHDLMLAATEDRKSRRKPGEVEKRRGRMGSAETLVGTRVPVATIRRLSGSGWSTARILENYPGISKADIKAALVDAETA